MNNPVLVSNLLLGDLEKQIHEDRRLEEYRPTVVAVLQSLAGFLLVESRGGNWGYVQGGIEPGEDVVTALFRELFEEVGIPSVVATEVRFCIRRQLPSPPGKQRDGYKFGKSYYYFSVRCAGVPAIRLQASELKGFQWLPLEELVRIIGEMPRRTRKKSEDMLEALRVALTTR